MTKKLAYGGRILFIGYGSVGRCAMPILFRHFDMPADRVAVIDGDDHSADVAEHAARGVAYRIEPIFPHNLDLLLSQYVGAGDLVLNLSVNVSSVDLMNWCQTHGALYLDTCVEPWANYYDNPKIPPEERSNYYLRHLALENAKRWPEGARSALLTHGANPGLISHMAKMALLDIARWRRPDLPKPKDKEEWARLAYDTGLKVIHVAEHDTQIANRPKRPGEFVNTWSVPGFYSEGMQPAELGWGTHEKRMPLDASEQKVGPRCTIFLNQPGCATQVRSWTPLGGPMIGFCITHGESVTLSDYFTVWDGHRPVYRPTVHYAYHPCNDAVLSVRELQMSNWKFQPRHRILYEEIVEGIDELGALLMGDFGAYWYGSQLSIEEARALLGPGFNATSIQIAAPVVAGAAWLVEHPDRGLVEPEDLDHDYVMEFCRPYLGPVVGVKSDWTPLVGRSAIFDEPGLDWNDPWQFRNFRVT